MLISTSGSIHYMRFAIGKSGRCQSSSYMVEK
jgi:hypothetical protein